MPLQDLLKGLCGPTGKQASHTMRDKCVRTSAICILNPLITKARLNYQALCFTLSLGFRRVYLHQDNFNKVPDQSVSLNVPSIKVQYPSTLPNKHLLKDRSGAFKP